MMWLLYASLIFNAVIAIIAVALGIRAEIRKRNETVSNRLDLHSASEAADNYEYYHSAAGLREQNIARCKVINNDDITIYSDKVRIKELSPAAFDWRGSCQEEREIIFRRAYCIEHVDIEDGLCYCTYSIHGRLFTDLSFAVGRTIKEYPGGYELREYEDGTKFLFSAVDIPTFDIGDRVWDSMEHTVVYRDEYGINLIQCRHGYVIPRINVYLGLKISVPGLTKWLELLT